MPWIVSELETSRESFWGSLWLVESVTAQRSLSTTPNPKEPGFLNVESEEGFGGKASQIHFLRKPCPEINVTLTCLMKSDKLVV
jgi:hypothetical protein